MLDRTAISAISQKMKEPAPALSWRDCSGHCVFQHAAIMGFDDATVLCRRIRLSIQSTRPIRGRASPSCRKQINARALINTPECVLQVDDKQRRSQ